MSFGPRPCNENRHVLVVGPSHITQVGLIPPPIENLQRYDNIALRLDPLRIDALIPPRHRIVLMGIRTIRGQICIKV